MVVWFLQKVQDMFAQFPVVCGNRYQAETTNYKTYCTIYSMAFFRAISLLYQLWVPRESSCCLSHSTWSPVPDVASFTPCLLYKAFTDGSSI